MASYTLVIGNKNYSSWSLRAWLMLKATSADFKEILIRLHQENSKQEILRYSPSGSVPVLLIDDRPVWDTLAIGETLNELFPEAKLWPANALARAHARSISAEMHSGFQALRMKHAMDIRRRETVTPDADVQAIVDRIEQLWKDARDNFGRGKDNFLYGNFTIADAMYAPVVSRFATHGFNVSDASKDYMDVIQALPAFREWVEAALQEPWVY